jgi:DNA-binding NarL/FixJ family response regulator
LWQRFTRFFTSTSLKTSIYKLNTDLADSIRSLAKLEQRYPQAVANELLLKGLNSQQNDENLTQLWASLTPREQDIAALICLEYTNPQIANHLHLSKETVKTHIRRIMLKFRVKDRKELRFILSDWDFSSWE